MRRMLAPLSAAAISLTGAAFVAVRLADARASATDALAGADPLWLTAGLVLAAAAVTALALTWSVVLRALGAPTSPATTTRAFFRGEIAKYAPGGVLAVVGRSEWAVRAGVARRVAYASTLLSLACMYMANAGLCVVLLAVGADGGDTSPALLLVLPLGVAALHPRVAGPVARRLKLPVLPWRTTARLVAAYAPVWVLIGAATVATTWAVHRDADVRQVLLATTASWLAGFLVAPAPAGLGVREAVFVAACGLPAGPATAAALLARLVFVVTDAVGFAAAVVTRGRRSGEEAAGADGFGDALEGQRERGPT